MVRRRSALSRRMKNLWHGTAQLARGSYAQIQVWHHVLAGGSIGCVCCRMRRRDSRGSSVVSQCRQRATNVSVNTPISATFSMAMNPATLTSATLRWPGQTARWPARLHTAETLRRLPECPLAYTTRYTATITTGATNLGGTPILANYVWTFTTILPAPAVVSTIPKNGAVNVPSTR